uniref:Putative gtp-binding protein h-ray n=1 Tax=Rhodnius prolixus TaxID=13249 RepID=R4G3C9_RHOPR
MDLGNPATGKTAISQVFISDGREFPKNYNMTLSAEVNSKFIQIPGKEDAVELLVYDSPSLDLYVDCLDSFWNNPDLLMIIYDVTNKKSLEDVKYWYSICMKTKWKGKSSSPIATVLFANKSDLDKRRICTDEEGISMAESLDMKYFSGSAKNNHGLEDPFRFLASEFYQYNLRLNKQTSVV